MKRHPQFSRSADTSGSALLMALWALLMLSAIVFAWVKFIDANMKNASEENFGFQARALAHSGVQIAMADPSPGSSLLQRDTAPDHGYQVTLTGEEGKLNLNWLLQGILREEPYRRKILEKYLALRGLKNDEVQTLIGSLLVWVDKTGKSHDFGAKDSDTYHPPHAYLITLEEVRHVSGSEPLVSQSGWEDDFTLWTDPSDPDANALVSPVNLRYASPLVLQSLPTTPPINSRQTQQFIDSRAGKDKIMDTQDDPKLDEGFIRQSLGISQPDYTRLTKAGLIASQKTKIWRAVSIGKAANHTRQVEAVFTQARNPAGAATGNPTINFWKEF